MKEVIAISPTGDERAVRSGLMEWSGPAHCTEELAQGMGFAGVDDRLSQARRLAHSLAEEKPLSAVDRKRTLLARKFQ